MIAIWNGLNSLNNYINRFLFKGLQPIEGFALRNEWLVLGLLFVINVVVRSIMLDYDSIFLDEGQTLFQINRPVERIIFGYCKGQQNAPLYFVLMH